MLGWIAFILVYALAASVTFYPAAKAMLKKFDLDEAKFSFRDSMNFSEESRERLEHHYSRLQGTLVFWKNNDAG